MNGEKKIFSIPFLVYVGLLFFGVVMFLGFYTPSSFRFASREPFSFSSPAHITLFVVGDMMLDRNVRNIINRTGFDLFFSGIAETVRTADLAAANLEGPFTTYPSVTASLVSKELRFTFDPALAEKLSILGFDVLGLANNHTLNFGREGFAMTRRFIGESGMFYYGDPNNRESISTIITKGGIRVGFVGFNEFSYADYDKVFAEIEQIRPLVDVLIVSPHWGPEYETEPTPKMKKWAREFIDSGADAVIGAHPHVVGVTEEYQNKKIYYSLGNFVFDQYFSEETMTGLGVLIDIEKIEDQTTLRYTDIPLRIDQKGIRLDSLDN
ncbi:MAG: CapA family protein [Patescibacteria group bacterium]